MDIHNLSCTKTKGRGKGVDIQQVNLTVICHKLGAALSAECSPISPERLLEIFVKRITEEGHGEFLYCKGETHYVNPTFLFAVYADWITDIGVTLGFDCNNDESSGEWITAEMLAVRNTTKDIRMIAVNGLNNLDERLQAEYGFSPSEVFLRSVNTGEPLEQSHVRLHAERQGLKKIK